MVDKDVKWFCLKLFYFVFLVCLSLSVYFYSQTYIPIHVSCVFEDGQVDYVTMTKRVNVWMNDIEMYEYAIVEEDDGSLSVDYYTRASFNEHLCSHYNGGW